MQTLSYKWREDTGEYILNFVPVAGTSGEPYLFGEGRDKIPIEINPFHMLATPVTQELWTFVMGSNPAAQPAPRHPVENVSWEHITSTGGFLDRINASEILTSLGDSDDKMRFRLPSETEWEYAARGGPDWTDGFRFSGSNDIDKVAWYGPRFGPVRRSIVGFLGLRRGWRITGRPIPKPQTRTHEVATKEPNRLGLYDMSGNVWEWCQDVCTEDLAEVPRDGKPYRGPGTERRLRGGCHHNWDLHCTVSWRYGIDQDAHDGCIGFRLVLSKP